MNSVSFAKLSSIDPGTADSYDRVFLTFDIDWAEDEVISDTVDLLEEADVEATWFVTHQTDILDRLRANPKFELGVHPNFNPLFDGRSDIGSLESVLGKLLECVPEAKCLRSHSLVTSTRLLQLMPDYGLTHESNIYLPAWNHPNLKPHSAWNGIVRVPHVFEDDLFLLDCQRLDSSTQVAEIGDYISAHFINASGVRVLDFHPIHVFLNTENLERYESARDIHHQPEELLKRRYNGVGVRSALNQLLRQE